VTELVFIRHGETDWNRQQRFQGQIDVPLNALGHTQAQRLAGRLGDERFDAFFSSDLQRALQTAAPLAAAWQQQPTPLMGLREQCFGMLEGLEVGVIRSRHADLWQRWLEHDGDYALPGGGESLRQFHGRVLGSVRELAQQMAGQRAVIVTHGGVLDMLWRTANGLPISGLRECHIPNTGINRLRWRDGTLHIAHWADDAHLDGLPEQPSTTIRRDQA
jgi:probable phosphoglycerate mutase